METVIQPFFMNSKAEQFILIGKEDSNKSGRNRHLVRSKNRTDYKAHLLNTIISAKLH